MGMARSMPGECEPRPNDHGQYDGGYDHSQYVHSQYDPGQYGQGYDQSHSDLRQHDQGQYDQGQYEQGHYDQGECDLGQYEHLRHDAGNRGEPAEENAVREGTQVTLTVPEGVLPGTLLAVPVRGGMEQVRVRVPEGVWPGSTLVLTQPDGCEGWELSVGEVGVQQPPAEAKLPEQPEAPQPGLDSTLAFTVRLETTAGAMDILVRPDWSPHGARRFLELAAAGDFDGLAFYRAVQGCVVQFGLRARRQWPPIPDDARTDVPFLRGAVSFAAVGAGSRKSTLFICVGDMSRCLGGSSWETPIGAVAEPSLPALDAVETCYGDIAEFGGAGPDTRRIASEGDAYLEREFPRLTRIVRAHPMDWQPEQDQVDTIAPPAQADENSGALQAERAHNEALMMEARDAANRAAKVAAVAHEAAQAARAAQIELQASLQTDPLTQPPTPPTTGTTATAMLARTRNAAPAGGVKQVQPSSWTQPSQQLQPWPHGNAAGARPQAAFAPQHAAMGATGPASTNRQVARAARPLAQGQQLGVQHEGGKVPAAPAGTGPHLAWTPLAQQQQQQQQQHQFLSSSRATATPVPGAIMQMPLVDSPPIPRRTASQMSAVRSKKKKKKKKKNQTLKKN
eukprot:NODE_3812_length_1981_cov_4.494067.p1 GENE.NODE_3812_length_1981_cov_4.494067~~NODE_3812_length_1981_cov_4.494067.p1  ORF type:complete len:622 (-),score=194.60 NODE_3812_length_1981_cov_4.494067:97-1962(-)